MEISGIVIQTLNRYTYVLNNPLCNTDPTGWWTVGFAIAGSAWSLGAFASGSCMFVFDGHGNWAIIASFGGGGGGGYTGSLSSNNIKPYGANGGGQVQVTNAEVVYQLAGPQAQVGGTVNIDKYSFTPEWVAGKGYMGGQMTFGMGLGFEMHGIVENGWILASGKLPYGDGQKTYRDSQSMGIIASSSTLATISQVADEATYKLMIDLACYSIWSELAAGQGIAWSSDSGYYAIDYSDYFLYDF